MLQFKNFMEQKYLKYFLILMFWKWTESEYSDLWYLQVPAAVPAKAAAFRAERNKNDILLLFFYFAYNSSDFSSKWPSCLLVYLREKSLRALKEIEK